MVTRFGLFGSVYSKIEGEVPQCGFGKKVCQACGGASAHSLDVPWPKRSVKSSNETVSTVPRQCDESI